MRCTSFEFINHKSYCSVNTFLDSSTMIFIKILYHHYKLPSHTQAPFPNLKTLFDTFGWKEKYEERRELINYLNRLTGEYDRFLIRGNIKFLSAIYYNVPEI